MKLWTVLLFACISSKCDGARILAFLPLHVNSHQTTFRPIFRRLAELGHDVTFVTSIPDATASYKQIVIDYGAEIANETDFFQLRTNNWLDDTFLFANLNENSMHAVFQNPEVQKLINSPEVHFDLVFTELSLLQYAYVVLGHRFKASTIELQGTCSSFWLYHVIGNPYHFSSSVDYNTYSSDRMNFQDRFLNTVMGVTTLLLQRYYVLPRQQAIADTYLKYPGWESRPSLLELFSNLSLVILNTHIATHYPHPHNPNIVEIAGIQVPKRKPLPQDLQTYLDNAKEGFIYFSLGSAIQASMMPEHIREAFISAFTKLPYKILWKWNMESMPKQPINVRLSKWFPQSDVLAHPNIRAFITHGGINSMTETVHHGVPVVVIPLFLDQWKNAKQTESAGYGITLNFDSISEETILQTLNTVISQPSFHEAAQKQSKILRDNPLSPLDRAVYWIEYVLRHQGAPHLRTAAASLPWYKYYLIDVVAMIIFLAVLVLSLICLVFTTLYRLMFARSGPNQNISSKDLKRKRN